MAPRPLRPKDERSPSEGGDKSNESQGSKRRAVSSACIPCRKRKSKCDGALPACSTCTAVYRTTCSYDADGDHRKKGALKRDIQSLQQRNDALDVIVTSLRNLQENEAFSLLHSLRSEIGLDVLADSLRTNVNLPQNFGHQTLEAEFAEQLSPAPGSSTSRGGKATLSVPREDSTDDSQSYSGAVTPAETSNSWFRIPYDAEFIEHLLSLYFCWIHPFYHFFSREHFLHDMNRGGNDYCSGILVNALLSFASHYSDRPSARADSCNPATAGEEFFAEAKRQLDRIERPCLTTVQALAIMSVRETSHGRDSSGYQYAGRCIRMTLELGLHLSVIGAGLRPAENEIRKLTFWSVFNLETFFSVFVGRLSQLPRAAADILKPTISDRTENQIWRRYDDTDLSSSQFVEEPSRSILFFSQLTYLSELASDMASDFYAPRERFTSRRLAVAYANYQEWQQNLPEAFRLENTSLPHVLVLHMYYYGCVLHLFRPYIKLDLRGANLFPRDTCTLCANEISNLTNALRNMHGLRRVCLPVTSLLLSASTIHLLNLPSKEAAASLSQGLHDLRAMSFNHQFAARCVDIIQSLAGRWNIALPEGAVGVSPLEHDNVSPSTSSNFWAASIPREGLARGASSLPTYPYTSSAFLQPPSQQQPAFAPIFSDTSIQFDPNQSQSAFWTPFPSQTMPVPPRNIVPSMTIGELGGEWSLADRPRTATSGSPAGSQEQGRRPGNVQQATDFEQWNWR